MIDHSSRKSAPSGFDSTSFDKNAKIRGDAPPVRIFQKDWMEMFTFISFRTFIIFTCSVEISVIFFAIHYATSYLYSFIYAIIGIISWIIVEYILHRYLFHFSSTNPSINRLIFIIHGNHHTQPDHPFRTLMPLIITLPLTFLLWGASVLIGGKASGNGFFAGFFLGYAVYDAIHYATHNFKMSSFPFSIWKRHHLLHHYMKEDRNYSISFPWLDNVVGSQFKKKKKKKK